MSFFFLYAKSLTIFSTAYQFTVITLPLLLLVFMQTLHIFSIIKLAVSLHCHIYHLLWCRQCRVKVERVSKNHLVNNLVEAYLNANPGELFLYTYLCVC